MKLIYIAGKYRADSEWGLVENIRKAEDAARWWWQKGLAVICPHKNTAHFGGCCDEKVFIEGDIEMLKRCDAIYMLDNWQQSEGAKEEHRIAEQLGMEIIYQA